MSDWLEIVSGLELPSEILSFFRISGERGESGAASFSSVLDNVYDVLVAILLEL